MISKGKYIGINQRIPFDVLDAALFRFLRDETILNAIERVKIGLYSIAPKSSIAYYWYRYPTPVTVSS